MEGVGVGQVDLAVAPDAHRAQRAVVPETAARVPDRSAPLLARQVDPLLLGWHPLPEGQQVLHLCVCRSWKGEGLRVKGEGLRVLRVKG